jgi:hypothetical protein
MEILKLKKWGKNKIKIESMSSIAKDKEWRNQSVKEKVEKRNYLVSIA